MEHARAIVEAAQEVHGVADLHLHPVEAAGRTDLAIARALLRAPGGARPGNDARADEVASRAVEAYADLCPADLSHRLAPGIVELLDALAERPETFALSLVTGNLEPVARL